MTPAIKLLENQKIKHLVHEYPHDAGNKAYGLEAADKLGLDPGRVFKTLVAQSNNSELMTAIIPVSHQLNMKQLAKVAGVKKVEMADPKVVERTTGYVLGGVSPLGQKRRLRTFIDHSAESYDTIYVSAGKRGLEIELVPDSLLTALDAIYADLTA